MLSQSLKLISKTVLAETLKCSRKTLTSCLRALACGIVLPRRCLAEKNIKMIDTWLTTVSSSNVAKMLFAVKYKYDEMSMECKIQAPMDGVRRRGSANECRSWPIGSSCGKWATRT